MRAATAVGPRRSDAVATAYRRSDDREIERVGDTRDDGVGMADWRAEERRPSPGHALEDGYPSLEVLSDAPFAPKGKESVVCIGM